MEYLGILLAAVVAMMIGAAWYGPIFGKQWLKAMHMKEADMNKDGMTPLYIIAFVNGLVLMYVLSYFIANLSDGSMNGALIIAFRVWLGFLVTQQVSNTLWSKHPSLSLVVINGAYRLVVAMLAAIIFTLI